MSLPATSWSSFTRKCGVRYLMVPLNYYRQVFWETRVALAAHHAGPCTSPARPDHITAHVSMSPDRHVLVSMLVLNHQPQLKTAMLWSARNNQTCTLGKQTVMLWPALHYQSSTRKSRFLCSGEPFDIHHARASADPSVLLRH
jgi:hypothetical protein